MNESLHLNYLLPVLSLSAVSLGISVARPGDVMLMSHCDPGQGIMTTGCNTEIQVLVAILIG